MVVDFENANLQNLDSICYMFSHCNKVQTLKLANMNTSSIKIACNMFYECENLISIDLGDFVNNTLTNMQTMFGYCSMLEYVDITGLDASKVTTCCMFSNCCKLENIDFSNFVIPKLKQKSMTSMFTRCSNMKSVKLPPDKSSRHKLVRALRSSFVSCTGFYRGRKMLV